MFSIPEIYPQWTDDDPRLHRCGTYKPNDKKFTLKHTVLDKLSYQQSRLVKQTYFRFLYL